MNDLEQLFEFNQKDADFTPTFCPHKDCPNRGKIQTDPSMFRSAGSFFRKGDQRFVRRFTCLQGPKPHSFSIASFSASYWLKRRDLMPKIAQSLCEQSSLRGIARTLEVSECCVSKQLFRIGRQCLLIHHMLLERLKKNGLRKLCFDELESWEVSQFVPTTHTLFLEPDSRFILWLQNLPINRKGEMTAAQKVGYEEWIEKYGKVPSTNSAKLVAQGLELLRPLFECSESVVVTTDKKKSYMRQLEKKWDGIEYEHTQLDGETERNTAPMSYINRMDGTIRQRCAEMRRETLDFMRRHANTNYRHLVFTVSHNLVKPHAGTRRSETPGTRIGLCDGPISWGMLLKKRFVCGYEKLPKWLQEVYFQKQRTPFFKNCMQHTLAFAD